MPNISVIVPVYNVEKYLYVCIESIVNQTYKDLEIILVNDGSNDKSYDICCWWAEQDNRIIVIDKENQGVSSSRNCGLHVARGKYIIFVDADDILKSGMIEYMMSFVEKYDVVGVNYATFEFENEFLNNNQDLEEIKCSFSELLQYRKGYFCWGIIYRNSIIQKYHMKFKEDIYNLEDVAWNSIYGVYVKNSIFIKGQYYGYRNRPESITQNCCNSRWQIESWVKVMYFLKKYKVNGNKKRKIAKEIRRCKSNIHAELFWGRMGIKELKKMLDSSGHCFVSLYFEYLPYRLLFKIKNIIDKS